MNSLFGKLFGRTSIRRTSNSRRRQLRPRTLGVEPLERRELLSVVSIIPAKDNSIYSGFVNNSNAKGLLYTGLNNDGNNIKRALMDFNVAAAVPAGSIITGVTLTMYCERNNNGATATDELHKLTKDWGEGTSMAGTLTKNGGQGTAATTNDATWKYDFYNTSSWATPGGDFSPTISGSTSIAGPGGTGSYTWASTAQMVADVQSWLDNPSANFGWLLKASAADELVNTSHAFYPREATNASQRPTLTITYTAAATNLPPTLNAIANPAAINENAGLQTVNLSGISAGAGETQALQVTATSNNTALIPNPTVSYTSPAATGSLTYTPVANQYGLAIVTVTVHDAGLDGIPGNGDDGTATQTFTVTVNQVNLPPTLNAISNPAAINENAGLQTVSLSGISAGAGETQALQVTATSSNTALIPNPTVSYTSPAATGSLTYTPVANQYGLAIVTVTVRDAGLDGIPGNGDDGTATQTFTVTVNQVNLPPTLNAISNPAAINENAGLQTVSLSGISAGAGETQALQVTATSSNTALIPNPTVSYTSPAATGSLTYTPVANQYGSAIVTVTVHDAGLDGIPGNGDDGTATQTFTVTVNQVNLPPTLNAISNPAAINENAGLQTVSLSGISAGAGETQALQVTATSSNTALIPNPTVSYTSPAATGSLTYTPVANQYGSAIVTVTVHDAGLDGILGNADDGIATQTFTVTVNQVNLPPTLNAIPNPAAINENAGLQTVSLSGISAGTGETQALQVTATSNNTALIPNPTVSYTSPAATGSLTYTPVANQYGSAIVTVTVHDAGLDGILGNSDDGTTAQTFTVTVNQVNLPPTLNAISNPAAINENAGLQTVNLSGISAGTGETQALSVTATSNNTALIPNPTVSYTSPAATGSLTYTSAANQYGSAIVTVTVHDAGLDGIPGNGDDGTATRTFTVTVNQVNLPPTLNAISNPAAIYQNSGLQTVNLTGITAGAGQTEALSVTATSDNAALVANPAVAYTSPNATGSLSYQAAADKSGTATITVSVHNAGLDGTLGTADDGVVTQTFTVTVNQGMIAALTPAKDNTLIQDATGSRSNGLGDVFVGHTSGTSNISQRGLTAFDLSSIPAGATIQSVTLTMYVDQAAVDTAQAIDLHKVLANWGEGASLGGGGTGAAAQPGDATWLYTFYPSQSWTTPGGDFSSTVSGSQAIGAASASYTWSSTAQMVADVQAWVNDPSSNFGWLLQGDETQVSSKKFASRESTTLANRPLLTVVYTPAPAPPPATVLYATASIQHLTLDNPGTDTFSVRIHYDPADAANTMLMSSHPTVTFSADTPALTAQVNATLQYDWGTWSGGTDFIAFYNVVNTGAVIPNVDMQIAGAKGAYSPTTRLWYDQASFTAGGAFSIDMTTAAPLAKVQSVWGTFQSVTAAAAAAQPGYWVRVHYAQPVSAGIQPTITFTGDTPTDTANINVTLHYNHGTWTSPQDYMAWYDVTNADVPLTHVYVAVAGAHDLTGNVQTPYQSPTAVFSIDTHDPTPALANVANLGASMQSVTAGQVGSQMYIEIVYDQTMDISSSPTIQFLDAAGHPTGVPGATVYENYAAGNWGSDHVYWAWFDIQNPYAGQTPAGIIIPKVGVQVTGARDTTGRAQTTYQQLAVFDIDTLSPTVSALPIAASVSPNLAVIADANAGTDKFSVRIDYDRPMWGGPGPSISFVPDPGTPANVAALANALTFDLNSSGWTNYDPLTHGYRTYWAWYNVADNVASIPYVGIKIKGAVDTAGHPQSWFEGSGFGVSMLSVAQPQTAGAQVASVTNPSYADAVLGSAALSPGLATPQSSVEPTSAAITPADYALLYSGTWLDA